MFFVFAALALLCPIADPAIDAQAVAELFRSYGSDFKDVQFIYEGTVRPTGPDESVATTFQGAYSFRNDGATLIDVFMLAGGNPNGRVLWSLLKDRREDFDASPDILLRLSERKPSVSVGAPGSFDFPRSPERLFLAYFFRSHANAEEFGLEPQGWEDVDGRRCLVVIAFGSPRPKFDNQNRSRSFGKFWLDLERNGNPLRIEWYVQDKLAIQTFVDLERLATPRGRLVWFPLQARTSTYGIRLEKGKALRNEKPAYVETYKIRPYTIQFDQGLPDAFFSTKKQAFVTSDESLAKLKRELESWKPARKVHEPSDPESRKRRLDDALSRADAQAARLEASSAARAEEHWSRILIGWIPLLIGVPLAGLVLYRSWSHR